MFLEQKQFYKSYDPGASVEYGRLSQWMIPGKYGIQTSGSSTTVTASNGSPFGPVTVGSRLVTIVPPEIYTERIVTAKASDVSITVDTAITLPAGTNWGFYHFKKGTTDADGWHNVANLSAITVYMDLEVLGSTSIDVTIQAGGGGPYTTPVTLSTTNLSSTGRTSVNVSQVVQSLRVGVKANGGPSTDAITIWLQGEHLLAGF